ncbi:unnamed protein product [Cuscuta epithymum]|uniref:Malectin-like domain-containing protein n=1 Tax=Cuscuta epithymum TaxID=186058 RepID=A0AAV0CS67_9ASTE|nr:unnamed protein product [Cuscuta epithymum]CAH9137865.1 unnamed protein product [Cuscuta epithymum]
MHSFRFFSIFITLCFAFKLSSGLGPYVMRISCGARKNVNSSPTNTLWYKDFAYTGGRPANGSRSSFISPSLETVRHFPLSDGPENCYDIKRVPRGHYSVRIYFGLMIEPSFDTEPLFDVSIEGTLIYSLPSGWSNHDDERAYVEALIFLEDGTASLCFHSTGHGDPTILAIEILQVEDMAYHFGTTGQDEGQTPAILRTHKRLSCGDEDSKFDADYRGDQWGGDRFWNSITTFGQDSDRTISTHNSIKKASIQPNVYPEALYKSAIVGTADQLDLTYTVDVEPNRNYSVWLHFAEIDSTITGEGQRVIDIMINGEVAFQDFDIVKMAGGVNTAVVLNKTVAVNGRSLTITVQAIKGPYAIINAIEIFEVVVAESKTVLDEVRALQKLKGALGLPLRLGWNGDPCAPQQHPWSGTDCLLDKASNRWVIDGIGLDNQGLRGFLPNEITQLRNLQSINLSGNSIQGPIPSGLGSVTSLEKLDLSYNRFNGSIPESMGQLTSLKILNLNGNSLSGRVPAALGGRLLHRASFNFTDNAGLCGIPGLRTCGPHLSSGGKIGVGVGVVVTFCITATFLTCWWKRRQNILRAKRLAAREAPYAKARTHAVSVQMGTRAAAENGPPVLT